MDIDPKTLARGRRAMAEAVSGWIYDPNVMLIDLGWPVHGGRLYEDKLAIRVHVIEKFEGRPALEAAIEKGITNRSIPDTIGGFPVDRPESGMLSPQQWWWGDWGQPTAEPRARRSDPMQGGISVSHAYVYGYGTLGGLVKDRETGKPMILSNWHVLAGKWYAQPGWPIYQPGRGDGGSSADAVATLSRHAMSSNLDAAVAELTGSRSLINRQFDLGAVQGVGSMHLGMEVIKSGRRTAVTRGRVTGFEGTAKILMTVWFDSSTRFGRSRRVLLAR